MNLGDTFRLNQSDIEQHLWVVVSDPKKNPDRVLLLSVTTYEDYKEDVCLINPNEHSWVKHRSCIAYDFPRVISVAQYHAVRDRGALQVFEPFSEHLLKRVWNGVLASQRLPMEHAEFLADQGLVDL